MPAPAKVRPLPPAYAVLAVLAFLLFARPYEGLRHDAVLYFGQVLLHSRVPALREDVFFSGGSQDAFSVYAHLIAPLYAALGQAATHQLLLLLGWVAMAGGVLALLRRFDARPGLAIWGLLAFALLSPIYGGAWVFGYSEPFLTARTLAEPLLVWALVLLLDGRLPLAALLTLLAGLLHPLMTLPVVTLAWCYLVMGNRRWLWLLLVLPPALLAGAAGLRPWSELLAIYDPYWWALVETGNRQVLLANWRAVDWLALLLDITILGLAARWAASLAWRRLLLATLAAGLLLFTITGIAADSLHLRLPTQLQLWRVHWVIHLLAQGLAPWLLLTLWQRAGFWRLSAASLVLALVNSHLGADYGAATLALWALSTLIAARVRTAPSPATLWGLVACVLLCALAMSVVQASYELERFAWQTPQSLWPRALARVAAMPELGALCLALLMLIASRGAMGRALAGLGAVTLLGMALATWDQRNDMARVTDQQDQPLQIFADRMPPHATVYWPDYLAPVWSLLERPSFYSNQQGAGLLFNRDTALTYGPRRGAFRLINEENERCRASAKLGKSREAFAACELPSRARLQEVCNAWDAPDYLVLRGRLDIAPLADWQPPVRRDLPTTYSLYSCAQLRGQEPTR